MTSEIPGTLDSKKGSLPVLPGRTVATVQAGKYRRMQGKRVARILGIIGWRKTLEVAPSRNQRVVRIQKAGPDVTRVDTILMPFQMKVDVSRAHLENHTVVTGSIHQVLATETPVVLQHDILEPQS